MRQTATIALLLLAASGVAQTPKTGSKPATAAKKAAPAAPKQSVARKTATRRTGAAKTGAKKRVVARSRVQQQPTPGRYTEIQQALLDKGYFAGPANGVWGPDSVAALKRFQEDQKLEATGKITALSLIRLGLGPNREALSQSGGPPTAPPKIQP